MWLLMPDRKLHRRYFGRENRKLRRVVNRSEMTPSASDAAADDDVEREYSAGSRDPCYDPVALKISSELLRRLKAQAWAARSANDRGVAHDRFQPTHRARKRRRRRGGQRGVASIRPDAVNAAGCRIA